MNQEKSFKVDCFVAAALVFIILASRLSNHLWNFTAVGGVALFAGAYFSRKYFAVATVFIGLLLSDFIIGFHNQMFAVYFSYALIIALGFLAALNSSRTKTLSLSAIGGVLFFLITNFAVWYGGVLYPLTFDGLLQCFTMAIPFFRMQLLSDLVSTFIIFEVAKLVLVPSSRAETVRLKL